MQTVNAESEYRGPLDQDRPRIAASSHREVTNAAWINGAAAIVVADPIHQRLIEAALLNLELIPCNFDGASIATSDLVGFELIIADESEARRIRTLMAAPDGNARFVKPGVVAVLQSTAFGAGMERPQPEFDGVLCLPQDPAQIAIQLGIILYSHRAFTLKYQSALEELQLNRSIFRSVTSGISVSNAQHHDMPLVYVNPAFEAMTGYSLEDVIGKNCRFLQYDDHNQPGLTLVREALIAHREVKATIRNYRKDGSSFWNELSLAPIFNQDGELTHYVGIQTDVTSRVEFEAALRESEKLAAVGRLAASIAHEINNPLESVMNLLYLARKSDENGPRSQYLAMADTELQRVAQITSQSLRFYRQSRKPQAVRVKDLMDSVLDVYVARVATLNIRVERRERMVESIVCLESEIRQVLSNLIRNAMDAMQGKPGRLLIRSRESTEWRTQRRGVMLTFADTGSGISPEAMVRLYNAFFTTKGGAGTGLGLWVSAEIVKRHHGRLRVRSRQKTGESWTVFQLFLPYQGPVEYSMAE